MALTPRLDLRQAQTLVMTPQLQQAIKLLQLSNMELTEFLESELEQNPLLKKEDEDSGIPGKSDDLDNSLELAEPSDNYSSRFEEDNDGGDAAEIIGTEGMPLDGQKSLDAEYDDAWAEDSAPDKALDPQEYTENWQLTGTGVREPGPDMIQERSSQATTLKDHLAIQILCDIADSQERLIAHSLVDSLDDAGYFHGSIGGMAESLGCKEIQVETVLRKIQKMDPTGVGARSLSECLAIQLSDKNRYDPAMRTLVENLELLGKRDFRTLLKKCGVDHTDLSEMIEEIRSLNPKPGSSFDNFISEPVTPDVIVQPTKEGGWTVELNSENLPRILVNNSYYNEIKGSVSTKGEKEYISTCLQSANWLIKALHQRAQTILKVSSEIVRHQQGFLENGVDQLKPLILRDIAEILNVHESTVSRVTTNKYMETPRGIFELKYFFTFALGDKEAANALSVQAIRAKIKKLIDQEPPNKILSDDKIVAILSKDGIEIARRTVAKYREGMKISSSVQRRREKRVLGPSTKVL